MGAFTAAVGHIQDMRSERLARRAAQTVPRELDDRYRAMFAKMGKFRGSYIKGLGFCLEPAEKALLAKYLFTEAADSEKNTLSAALMEDLDRDTAKGLFEECILHYDDMGYKPMFETLRTHKGCAGIVENEYGYKPDRAFGAMLEGKAPEYFNGVASMKATSGEEGYFDALEEIGVPRDCGLFEKCAQLYILVCDAKDYKRFGAEELIRATQNWNKDLKRRLLENMLAKLDEFQLRAFVPMLDMFMELTGEEGSATYEQCMAGISGINRRKYAHWMSQYVIFGAFGTGERTEFWLDYIDRYKVSQHGPSGALIFDFGSFKVIEFKSDLAAYFYDTEYFEQKVVDGLAAARSEADLDSWLEKRTDWAMKDDGENDMHWRKAHKGNWKQDMRDYIQLHAN